MADEKLFSQSVSYVINDVSPSVVTVVTNAFVVTTNSSRFTHCMAGYTASCWAANMASETNYTMFGYVELINSNTISHRAMGYNGLICLRRHPRSE